MALASRTLANIGSSVGLPQNEVSVPRLADSFCHIEVAQRYSLAPGVSQTPGAYVLPSMQSSAFLQQVTCYGVAAVVLLDTAALSLPCEG